MAYISHSPYRAYSTGGEAFWKLNSGILLRSAVVALVAGAVIIALSGAASREDRAATKGDRIAAAKTISVASATVLASDGGAMNLRDETGRVVYSSDPATRTTTVVRGATIPLVKGSPLGAGGR